MADGSSRRVPQVPAQIPPASAGPPLPRVYIYMCNLYTLNPIYVYIFPSSFLFLVYIPYPIYIRNPIYKPYIEDGKNIMSNGKRLGNLSTTQLGFDLGRKLEE